MLMQDRTIWKNRVTTHSLWMCVQSRICFYSLQNVHNMTFQTVTVLYLVIVVLTRFICTYLLSRHAVGAKWGYDFSCTPRSRFIPARTLPESGNRTQSSRSWSWYTSLRLIESNKLLYTNRKVLLCKTFVETRMQGLNSEKEGWYSGSLLEKQSINIGCHDNSVFVDSKHWIMIPAHLIYTARVIRYRDMFPALWERMNLYSKDSYRMRQTDQES